MSIYNPVTRMSCFRYLVWTIKNAGSVFWMEPAQYLVFIPRCLQQFLQVFQAAQGFHLGQGVPLEALRMVK